MCSTGEDAWILDITVSSLGDLDTFNEIFKNHCFKGNKPAIFRNVQNLKSQSGCTFFDVEKIEEALNYNSLSQILGSDKQIPVVIESVKQSCSTPATEERCYERFDERHQTMCTLATFFESQRTGEDLYYLKDWHFLLEHQAEDNPCHFFDNILYLCPDPLREDWLNEYCLRNPRDYPAAARRTDLYQNDTDLFSKHVRSNVDASGDYRFVYIGDVGSSTPPHIDVFASYSWSLNVRGHKRWSFFLPEFESEPPTHLGEDHPHKLVQNPGDLIFVPSAVCHRVVNIASDCGAPDPRRDFVTSVNQNWFNRYNVARCVVPLLCQEAVSAHTSVDLETRLIFRMSDRIGEATEQRRRLHYEFMGYSGEEAETFTDSLSHFLTSVCATVAHHDRAFGEDAVCPDDGPIDRVRSHVMADGWFAHVEVMLQSSGAWNLLSMRRLLCFVADERRKLKSAEEETPFFADGKSDLKEAILAISMIDKTIVSILELPATF